MSEKYPGVLSRTTGPISTKLNTEHPWVKGIQFLSNEGLALFLRGDNSKNWKKILTTFEKKSSPEPLGQIQPNMTKSILGEGNLIFFKLRAMHFIKERKEQHREEEFWKASAQEPLEYQLSTFVYVDVVQVTNFTEKRKVVFRPSFDPSG